MRPYLIGFAIYAFVCTVATRALGWPWWSTAPLALVGVGALAAVARARARRAEADGSTDPK